MMRTRFKFFRRGLLAPAAAGVALLSPAFAQDDHPEDGVIKICKVAGANVSIGEQFVFGVDSTDSAADESVTVPAGPGPDGWCFLLMREVAPGSTAVITGRDLDPLDAGATSISVEPPGNQIGAADLEDETVTVAVGPGVTEVTFVNERGYFEICKSGGPPGDYAFSVEGRDDPVIVPGGACSPALLAPAGVIEIDEIESPAATMTGCATYPADRLAACNPGGGTVSLNIAPGDISDQTIVFIENAGGPSPPDSTGVEAPEFGMTGRPRPASRTPKRKAALDVLRTYALAEGAQSAPGLEAATTTIACAANAGRTALTLCTARVKPLSAAAVPTGLVRFTEGEKLLAILPLKRDGTATLAMPAAMAASHAVAAAYDGDKVFAASFSAAPVRGAPASSGVPPGSSPAAEAIRIEPKAQSSSATPARIYRPGERAPGDHNAAVLNAVERMRAAKEAKDE